MIGFVEGGEGGRFRVCAGRGEVEGCAVWGEVRCTSLRYSEGGLYMGWYWCGEVVSRRCPEFCRMREQYPYS